MAIVQVGSGPNTRPVTGGTPVVTQHVNSRPGTQRVAGPPRQRPATKCSENNKMGKPCGAPPAKGLNMCIGHQRKAGLI